MATGSASTLWQRHVRIPVDVLDRFPDQPWRQMVAMRNLAAHQYHDLDPRRAWITATRDVPSLAPILSTS